MEPIEIARLEERRQARATSEIGQDSIEVGGGTATFDTPGSWANFAIGLGLSGPVSGAELDRLVSFYESRGVEATVEVCSFADASILSGLASRGFGARMIEHVMACPLGGRTVEAGPRVDGLTLERVDPADAGLCETFARVAISGFVPDGEPPPDAAFESALKVVRHPRSISVLARVNGEPAGAGGSEVCEVPGGPVVSALFGASVLPRFRRRGVQQRMILERLRIASERGAVVACIGSKPGIPTERNAARLGFNLAYAKVTVAKPGDGLVANPVF